MAEEAIPGVFSHAESPGCAVLPRRRSEDRQVGLLGQLLAGAPERSGAPAYPRPDRSPENAGSIRESPQREAIVRSPGRFSRKPAMSILKHTKGSIGGRPPLGASAQAGTHSAETFAANSISSKVRFTSSSNRPGVTVGSRLATTRSSLCSCCFASHSATAQVIILQENRTTFLDRLPSCRTLQEPVEMAFLGDDFNRRRS